ncbi:MAG TPA: tRNA threonylcarbamoyladenosine dehydratase [Verrucomicrobiae bacterium]|nr:tRNA threonylcarbamoyladenosine dehydratase [Verrucomicrobiae bacterium]
MDPYERRFGGLARLYGRAGLERLRRAHVCVVGLGGVGSWAVEALARSGVGRLTLIDLDDVCISNVNRQLHALDGELGKPKVEVMARRVAAINPDCVVQPLHAFFLKSNASEILANGFDAVLDAIDSPSLKCVLISSCKRAGIPVTVVGGAGGRQDPTAIEITDLAFSSGDRLLQHVRRKLRRDYGFPRGDQDFGIESVVSREAPMFPTRQGCVSANRAEAADLRLDCSSGFGTASFVTGAFGLAAASRIVRHIASGASPKMSPISDDAIQAPAARSVQMASNTGI